MAKTLKKKKRKPSASAAGVSTPGPKKANPKPEAEAAGKSLHGVDVLASNLKKGGTAKHPVSAMLSLAQIKVIPDFNPRAEIGDVASLAKSIREKGVLSSLVVRPGKKDGTFELVAGERRYRALESLEWSHPIPVQIRTDLDDDESALAVAVAENSEDGRQNLNAVELGRVCAKLAKKKWDVARIARECAIHPQKVRRVLSIMEQPSIVQKKIEAGEMNLQAGLELAKLDDKMRDDVIKAMGDGEVSTAADIRRLRKSVEAERNAEEVATKGSKKTKSGTTAKRVATAWKGSREKQEMLQVICAKLVAMDHDESDADFIEARAMVCTILWDRGDIDTLDLPSESATDAKSKKALALLWGIFKQEAAKHAEAGEGEEAAEDEKSEAED